MALLWLLQPPAPLQSELVVLLVVVVVVGVPDRPSQIFVNELWLFMGEELHGCGGCLCGGCCCRLSGDIGGEGVKFVLIVELSSAGE